MAQSFVDENEDFDGMTRNFVFLIKNLEKVGQVLFCFPLLIANFPYKLLNFSQRNFSKVVAEQI